MAKNSQKLLSFAVRKMGNFHVFAQSTRVLESSLARFRKRRIRATHFDLPRQERTSHQKSSDENGGRKRHRSLENYLPIYTTWGACNWHKCVIPLGRIRKEREEEEEELFPKALGDEGFRRPALTWRPTWRARVTASARSTWAKGKARHGTCPLELRKRSRWLS